LDGNGFIQTLRGVTTNFGSFDHAEFHEIDFERNLNNLPMAQCWYWVRKLQARFFAGDFASAIEASLKARPLLLISPGVELTEYEFYGALARAACCDSAAPDQSREHFDALGAHYKQLEIWAEHCPENFENRAALVGAEIARIQGCEVEAELLYEQAIRSARANGFVHNEGLAYEVAARFYAARGFETFADAYLLNARNCYYRWGAHGKVRQLDERYPRLREERIPAPLATIDPPVGQLDVETVVKASQAMSSEMVLAALIEKLVRIAMENAGAERGLLILVHGDEPRIEAEATTGMAGIEVVIRQTTVAPTDLPQSALHYVIRTQESVLLDDASADQVYSNDEYVRQNRSRSILCLPIVKQAKLVGVLYLENNLTMGAFTPDRVTVLQLLASQAAISIENATLYSDLQLQAELLHKLPVSAWTLMPDGTPDFVNQVWLEYSGQSPDFIRSRPEAWMNAVHPEDREAALRAYRNGINLGRSFAFETRSLRAEDGTYRWHLQQAVVLRDAEGKALKFVGTTTDIDDQKRAEEKLRESEYESRLIVDSIPGLIAVLNVNGEIERVSQPVLDYFGRSLEELRQWAVDDTIHPDDRSGYLQAFERSFAAGDPFEIELRTRRFDGVYRWFNMRGLPLRDRQGHIVRWYFLLTEIDDRKRAEDKIRQSEKEARQLLDLSPLHIAEMGPDGARRYLNRASLDYLGVTLEEWQDAGLKQVLHPQDAEIAARDLPGQLQSGSPFEYELRLRRKDGQYRWFHFRFNPVSDEEGRVTRWYLAGTDIDDRKLAEQRLQEENVALREEIDKASMFEEIVGTSAPLKKVLSRISRVAPTDSTVLITGETGTGKELVARAIHRRSRRSPHPFVSLNCAAIPRDLIASELFGHELGAFTGATQRRLGRFELATGGTLFLDEVGELPAETQVTLLRVLQEHEFERIGGAGSIRVDVRVIAATNRNLEEAIRAGTFRSDLFYRLNVFPVEVPALRERKEDVPLLLRYFLDRYGMKAGKSFKTVDKRSLDLLQSYPWPGNIRELQNVIERSVIVSDSEVFSVDESWLSRRPPTTGLEIRRDPFRTPPAEEKATIEAALRECGGRVYGPTGAAEKLGIPRSTLESKIRTLKINKNRFRGPLQD
jgi:PAS domain S-box-containing protein